MYQLIHSFAVTELFKRQLFPFGIAFVIAELFYKFHSFALECAGFLATWYVLDAILHFFVFRSKAGAEPGRP